MQSNINCSPSSWRLWKFLKAFKIKLMKFTNVSANQKIQILFFKRCKCLIKIFTCYIFAWVSGTNSGNAIVQRDFDKGI